MSLTTYTISILKPSIKKTKSLHCHCLPICGCLVLVPCLAFVAPKAAAGVVVGIPVNPSNHLVFGRLVFLLVPVSIPDTGGRHAASVKPFSMSRIVAYCFSSSISSTVPNRASQPMSASESNHKTFPIRGGMVERLANNSTPTDAWDGRFVE